ITVTVNSDGTSTLSMAGANGTERLHVDSKSARAYTLTADANGDGKVDERMTATESGGVTTTVWERDDGLSGTFNWRATMTFGDPAGVGSQVEEIPFGGSAYAVTSTYAASVAMAAQACATAKPADIEPGQACDAVADAAGSYAPKPSYCQSGAS